MYRIAEAFVRWIAPILSFTADEMWQYLPSTIASDAHDDADVRRRSQRHRQAQVRALLAASRRHRRACGA
jgi:isoleucyl-tRNA synthetase